MSRCVLDNEDTGDAIVIGWDPGLQTYFAQVFEAGVEDPSIWMGTLPGEYREPDAVIEAVRPYACSFDSTMLENNLRIDKRENSERIYAIDSINME